MPVSERYLWGATRERLKIMGGGGVRFLGQVESSYPLVLPGQRSQIPAGHSPKDMSAQKYRCQVLRGCPQPRGWMAYLS